MARKTDIVTVTADGRDQGKTFLITEFPPRKAEKWAARALISIAKSGKDNLDSNAVQAIKDAGLAAMAALGLRAITSMSFEDAEPLLDEMMDAVTFIPDASKVDKTTMRPHTRFLGDDDIEEVATILLLRDEVFKLHTGFSVAAYLSMLGQAAKAAATGSPATPTSQGSSET